MDLLYLAVVALLPGCVFWWKGRALVARRAEPELPERLSAVRRQAASWTWLSILAIGAGGFFSTGPRVAAAFGLLFFAVSAGGFPARRTLLGEDWSFFTCFFFQARLVTALTGFWLALMVAPVLVSSISSIAGDDPVWGILIVGIVLMVWNLGYRRLLLALLRARPLTTSELAPLAPGLDAIRAQTGLPPVELLVFPTHGGLVANAFALPSPSKPSVLLSRPLLERFEPPEVMAIFAHEVGHLEYFDRRRLRWMSLAVVGLIFLGLLIGPVHALVSDLDWLPSLFWLVLVLTIFSFRNRWMQRLEIRSDLRAAELCGDPEVVVAALVKLHDLALVPHEMDRRVEKNRSHPSLATRIAALRAAPAAQPASTPATPPSTTR